MDLNWTPAVIFGIIGMISSVVALLVTIYQIQKGSRYLYFYLSTLVWACICLGCALWTHSYLFLDLNIYRLCILILPISGFFLLIESDCISREMVDPVKLIIYVLLSTAVTVLELNKPIVFFVTTFANGEVGISSDPSSMGNFIFLLMIIMPGSVYVFNVARMNQQVPKKLKKYSRLYLAGLSINVFGFTIAIFTVGFSWVPGLQMFSLGVGACMMAITIAIKPRLAFILPFKALRLTVVDLRSGIPLFQHIWDATGVQGNDDLHAGMLQGVNMILKESLQRGDVQEIKLAQATILAFRDNNFPVACVIVTTKTSRTLRDALKLFAEKFYAQYSQFFDNPNFTKVFSPANVLVGECFPFVPEYD